MATTLQISSNGQVSIPAEIRHRWQVASVVVIDRGDHVIVRPRGSARSLRGAWRGRMPSTAQMRAEEREERR